jgi:hypothetical protein
MEYVAYDQCANSVTVYVQQDTHLKMILVRAKHVVYWWKRDMK